MIDDVYARCSSCGAFYKPPFYRHDTCSDCLNKMIDAISGPDKERLMKRHPEYAASLEARGAKRDLFA
jgi:hypothetical protein